MNQNFKVYCYTNLINNKKYIGVTKTSLEKRAGCQGSYYEGCTKFYNAIKKYGWDAFQSEILKDNLTQQKASEYQKYYIDLYQTQKDEYGYNLREGGYDGYSFTMSEETKKKISDSLKGTKKPEQWYINRKKYYQTHFYPNEGKFGENSSSKTQKVRCKETQDVFGAVAQAERWSGSCKVGECCRGLRQHAGKHPTEHYQLMKIPLSQQFVTHSFKIEEKYKRYNV